MGIPWGLGDRIDGTGDPAALLLAWASRKAATEIRCDESEAVLAPRGRATGGGGVNDAVDVMDLVGDGGRTCLKDLRLNEAESGERRGADEGLALCRDGFDGVEFVLLDQLKKGRFWVRDGVESGEVVLLGRERVESVLLGSP